ARISSSSRLFWSLPFTASHYYTPAVACSRPSLPPSLVLCSLALLLAAAGPRPLLRHPSPVVPPAEAIASLSTRRFPSYSDRALAPRARLAGSGWGRARDQHGGSARVGWCELSGG
uniref:Uncharacterized protein n=1 Tax=Aegilops tauschii subsp. strangulata TaxID=200361 RepID=A0A453T1V7_AEGTS